MAELRPYPFEFKKRFAAARDEGAQPQQQRCGVVIVGGGIAGLTAALALAGLGIRSLVVEADDTVCFGSRAICFSRRSLEIFDRLGVLQPMLDKGLAWSGGRSFHGKHEILHFSMPDDDEQQLPPMINIQQYHVEEYLVQALEQQSDMVEILWGTRLVGFEEQQGGASVRLTLQGSGVPCAVEADWVVACDGGRSFVRESLGLPLHGTAYEGRYVIADIALDSMRPTERLAWFDPPSNPGATILMHRQPDGIWRIDYQLRDDEDPEEAVKPENVLPRIAAHLEMIGERGAWTPLWISIYKANALSLERFRAGRVLLAGDAAHLVPIFGVRGANSAIDDVDNLAWKLAHVIEGRAGEALLDSYSDERVAAAQENLRHGMKSTEFMAPPSLAFKVMREAVLELAVDTPALRSLINPRQTSSICYDASPLHVAPDEDASFDGGPRRGSVLQSARVTHVTSQGVARAAYLTQMVRPGEFLLLHFSHAPELPPCLHDAVDRARQMGLALRLLSVHLEAPTDAAEAEYLLDGSGHAMRLYAGAADASYLVRPDAHVLGRWRHASEAALVAALAVVRGMPA